MPRTLDVYLDARLVGELRQDGSGRLRFQYHPAWLSDPNASPLSRSLPLRPEAFAMRNCRPFFAGLLPEGELRELIARTVGVSPRNDFALLDRVGGECAGAVSLQPAGARLEPDSKVTYRPVS